jgi:hypothetical protein
MTMQEITFTVTEGEAARIIAGLDLIFEVDVNQGGYADKAELEATQALRAKLVAQGWDGSA